MISDEPGADSKSSGGLASKPLVTGATFCLILLLLVQADLLIGTRRVGDGGIGRALWHWVLRRPPSEPDVWHQVSAPIAKTMLATLPANVRQRAAPVIDWLTRSDGIQRGEIARILLVQDDLTVDIYGIDETGCRRILAAASMPGPPIDVIGVSAADPDMRPAPTSNSDETQCGRKTGYLRMISRSHPSRERQ